MRARDPAASVQRKVEVQVNGALTRMGTNLSTGNIEPHVLKPQHRLSHVGGDTDGITRTLTAPVAKFRVKDFRLVKPGLVGRRYRPVKQVDLPMLVTFAPRHRRSGGGAVEQHTVTPLADVFV